MKYQKCIKLSVIIGVFGQYSRVGLYIDSLIQSMKLIQDESVEFIVVCDGAFWKTLPTFQMLPYTIKQCKVLYHEHEESLPAKLYNVGLQNTSGDFIHFTYLNNSYNIVDIYKNLSILEKEHNYFFEKPLKKGYPFYPDMALRYGWLQTKNIFELHDVVLTKKCFMKYGKFNESEILQKHFDWEFFLKVSKEIDFKKIQKNDERSTINLDDYPYVKRFNIPIDLVHRFVLRINDSSCSEETFLKDLPINDAQRLSKLLCKNIDNAHNKPLKITVIGGHWEYIHNQLCFYNYFDSLYGKGILSYKVLLDEAAATKDLIGNDLVIFSRSKSDNAKHLIDFCNNADIPTLYMIDDNWFTVATDWPDAYKTLFSPGCPMYDNFIYIMAKSSAVLLYNDILEQYARTVNPNIYKLKININTLPTEFSSFSSINIGYAGSPRFSNFAFQALLKIATDYPHVNIFYFGNDTKVKDQFQQLQNAKILDWTTYHKYNSVLLELGPTIMLAPLDDSLTSQSKCANKYLEITSVGAIGIYTDTQPYRSVIQNGYNGILIKEDTVAMWYNVIKKTIKNKDEIHAIFDNALKDVKVNYLTEVVLPSFIDVITAVSKDTKND